jgi:hypothetical protein
MSFCQIKHQTNIDHVIFVFTSIQVKCKENGIDETLPNFIKRKHSRKGEKKK